MLYHSHPWAKKTARAWGRNHSSLFVKPVNTTNPEEQAPEEIFRSPHFWALGWLIHSPEAGAAQPPYCGYYPNLLHRGFFSSFHPVNNKKAFNNFRLKLKLLWGVTEINICIKPAAERFMSHYSQAASELTVFCESDCSANTSLL